MSHHQHIQDMYTKRRNLYHLLFNNICRYKHGMHSFLKKSDYIKPYHKILDAGCGPGTATQILHSLAQHNNIPGLTFHAFDLTPAMIAQLRCWIMQHELDTITTRLADVLELDNLPADWNEYDLILATGMLEHLPKEKMADALANLKRLLNRQGKLVIAITKHNPLMRLLIQSWWKANMYKKNELISLLHDAGFNRINFNRFSFPHNHLNFWGYIIEAM